MENSLCLSVLLLSVSRGFLRAFPLRPFLFSGRERNDSWGRTEKGAETYSSPHMNAKMHDKSKHAL